MYLIESQVAAPPPPPDQASGQHVDTTLLACRTVAQNQPHALAAGHSHLCWPCCQLTTAQTNPSIDADLALPWHAKGPHHTYTYPAAAVSRAHTYVLPCLCTLRVNMLLCGAQAPYAFTAHTGCITGSKAAAKKEMAHTECVMRHEAHSTPHQHVALVRVVEQPAGWLHTHEHQSCAGSMSSQVASRASYSTSQRLPSNSAR